MARVRRVVLMAVGAVVVLLGGAVVWNKAVPPPAIPEELYPRAGAVLRSNSEGFTNEVVDVRDGMVISKVTLDPFAKGPPLHYHDGFDELFQVEEGTLSIELEGEVRQLKAGESFRVAAGMAHRPFNATGQTVRISEGPAFPVRFGACLSQLYGFMDQVTSGPGVLLQLSLMRKDCDTHVAGPPRAMEEVIMSVAGPIARLKGYTPYRAEWAPAGAKTADAR